MGGGFDRESKQNERSFGQAMMAFGSFGGRQAEEHRQVRDRTGGEFLFVERQQMGEVARWGGTLQTKFGDRLGEGASKAGCLSHGSEVGQTVRRGGGVNNSRGQRLNAEARDGSQRETAHGLRREMGGELGESEGVNALASRWEGVSGQFVGGGSGGGDDEDFGVLRFFGEKSSGVLEEGGVGAGVNERARGHRQLYLVEIPYDATLGA
jgi:hypothetical protein